MRALIVAGEASGDIYGAELSSELQQQIPSLRLTGMGGPLMQRAGVDLLCSYRDVAVVGVFEVLSKLRNLQKTYVRLREWILENNPDFAILIDFPDFNFRLAKLLKKNRIKIFYFISPQIWAWRKKRIHFLKEHIDLMISILPFERKLYEEAGVPVVYVGHPLVEIVSKEVAEQPQFSVARKPLLGIMPGSRDVEMKRHLPLLLETIARIRRHRQISAVLIWPPSLSRQKYNAGVDVEIEENNRYAAVKACDLLLVASGTSTLEAAILGVPLFIVYRVGKLSWLLGKLLVRVPYYGLVNWIAQRKCIPEYMQDRMNPSLLARDALAFLENKMEAEKMKSELARIVESLGPPGAIQRAAAAIVERL